MVTGRVLQSSQLALGPGPQLYNSLDLELSFTNLGECSTGEVLLTMFY